MIISKKIAYHKGKKHSYQHFIFHSLEEKNKLIEALRLQEKEFNLCLDVLRHKGLSCKQFYQEYGLLCWEYEKKQKTLFLLFKDSPKERNSFKLLYWIKCIIKKFGKRCVECGKNDFIEFHHIFPWKSYPDLRFDDNNGVPLCEPCHKDWHKKYGYGQTKKIDEEIIRKYREKWQKTKISR